MFYGWSVLEWQSLCAVWQCVVCGVCVCVCVAIACAMGKRKDLVLGSVRLEWFGVCVV